MNYKITEHYARGEEKPIAEFNNKNDANLFVVCKFEDDNTVHDNDIG